LSGGEKQKTTLLSILMTEPEILMLDEPTAFLDPQSALEIMGIIQHMDTSKTLIFVEHNLQYLKPLIDRNLHLESKGKVIDRSRAEICWNPQLPVLRKQAVGKPLMNLSGIEFSFPSNFLLKGIDLELHEGEIITLTGRNGSGKTTLLEIMAGLRKPHQGKITIENHETVNDINRIRKLTGLLFQNPENHFIYNSVKEELQGNEIKYLQEEFAEKNEQSPFTLSEGEKRRLSIAIACLRNKQILLWDEPTFGQDLQNKLKLIKLADKLRQSGMGIVIVSHDTAFVQAVSDRIYKLKEGRLDG
jgi:energy-coupling factor transport system ATP-binding protein